jgi:hypothetical protein
LRRNCLLKHIIEGKIEGRIVVTGWWRRRRKQLLDELKEKRGYWKLKGEALDGTLWRTRCGRGYGPVVRQITEWSRELGWQARPDSRKLYRKNVYWGDLRKTHKSSIIIADLRRLNWTRDFPSNSRTVSHLTATFGGMN